MNKTFPHDAERELSSLKSEYLPLIRLAASRYDVASLGLGLEDLELEGLCGLFRAVEGWRADGGASFSTYAAICIRNAVSAAVSAAAAAKHLPLNAASPLESLGDAQAAAPSAEEETMAEERRAEILGAIRDRLSPLERSALTLHIYGVGPSEAALRLGRSEKSVENALGRARVKIRESAAAPER